MIIEINYFNVVITNHSISNIFYNIYNFSKYKIISTWHMPFSAIFNFQFSKKLPIFEIRNRFFA